MATSPEPFTSAADAYDRHVGRYGAQLAAGLIEAASIRPGHRVLDVGCGPGPLTRALADRIGESNVATIDPSPEFVDACRARVPGADVRAGRAEELPFAADTFDAALAQLVVQLMDDRDAGVAEMVRVTRPGGHHDFQTDVPNTRTATESPAKSAGPSGSAEGARVALLARGCTAD